MTQHPEPPSGESRPGPVYTSAPSRPPIDPLGGPGAPPPPPSGPGGGGGFGSPGGYPPPRRHGASVATRVFMVVLIVLLLGSVLVNIVLVSVVGIGLGHMNGLETKTYTAGTTGQWVAVIPISGVIDEATADFVHETLQKLENDKPVAVILRVDSPGGGVSPSDRIAHELRDFKERNPKLPMVASFGGMAASGGYYISANADYIIAEPTTLTGSIGVIAEAFTVDKLLDKVGVTPETVTSRAAIHKDDLSPFHAWTDADRDELRSILDQAHARFVEVVSQGRKGKLSEAEVRALATGQAFTAKEAIKNKLVDEEGYLEAAVAKAVALAGLPPSTQPDVKFIQKQNPFSLFSLMSRAPEQHSLSPDQVRKILGDMMEMKLEYRMAR